MKILICFFCPFYLWSELSSTSYHYPKSLSIYMPFIQNFSMSIAFLYFFCWLLSSERRFLSRSMVFSIYLFAKFSVLLLNCYLRDSICVVNLLKKKSLWSVWLITKPGIKMNRNNYFAHHVNACIFINGMKIYKKAEELVIKRQASEKNWPQA